MTSSNTSNAFIATLDGQDCCDAKAFRAVCMPSNALARFRPLTILGVVVGMDVETMEAGLDCDAVVSRIVDRSFTVGSTMSFNF